MTDHQTKNRQAELSAWQRNSLASILADSSKPAEPGAWNVRFWRVLETLMTWLGMFWLGVVCLWVVAAFLGFYFEMAASGFAFGRGAIAWLLEIPR